jgi:hypothetical protein
MFGRFRSMNRRVRVLSALLALLAFSAYFAESVMASSCLPGGGAEHVVASGIPGVGMHGGMNHTPSDPSDGSRESHPDSPSCPIGMMGTGGSCVAASLPARADAVRPMAPNHNALFPGSDQNHGLLLVAAHFRPPRA